MLCVYVEMKWKKLRTALLENNKTVQFEHLFYS